MKKIGRSQMMNKRNEKNQTRPSLDIQEQFLSIQWIGNFNKVKLFKQIFSFNGLLLCKIQ